MKILLVEDNEYKREKVSNAIKGNKFDLEIIHCGSYSSAIEKLSLTSFDFAIIDMSLPTFDKGIGSPTGEFRTFGGMEIAKYIKRKKIKLKYIFLTQYSSFAINDQNYDLKNIKKDAEEKYSENFMGCVYYENSSLEWKKEVLNFIGNI